MINNNPNKTYIEWTKYYKHISVFLFYQLQKSKTMRKHCFSKTSKHAYFHLQFTLSNSAMHSGTQHMVARARRAQDWVKATDSLRQTSRRALTPPSWKRERECRVNSKHITSKLQCHHLNLWFLFSTDLNVSWTLKKEHTKNI